MHHRIIYTNDNGSVSVIVPSPDCGLTVEQIARKDVPFGKPFKIVDASEIPSDRTQRNAWAVDSADLTDGVGADYGVGSNKPFVMPELTQ
jgi:hypothetical protein